MAEYTVTIKGADDIFKKLDAAIDKLNKSLEKTSQKSQSAGKGFEAFGKTGKKFQKVMAGGNKVVDASAKVLSTQGAAIGAMSAGLLKGIPYIGAFVMAIEGIGKAVNAIYQAFLSQNKLLEQTGDVFASVDLTTGNLSSALHRMRSDLVATAMATMDGTTTVKDHLEALKGYQQAGLVVTDLKDRFNLLAEATGQAITYATLFTMKTDEMAGIMGNFIRELNLGASDSAEAFNGLFKAAVDARYGTRNFLSVVNQTVPTIGIFGGSVQEVGRMLQFMGRQGTISMDQAGQAVKFLTTGVKEMNLEQKTTLAALASQDTLMKLGQRRMAALVTQQEKAEQGSAEWWALQNQIERLQVDLMGAAKGSRISAGRMLEQLGPGDMIEVMFEAFGKIPGMQLQSLSDLNKISAEQEMALLGIMKEFGMTQKELRILQKIGSGQIETTEGGLVTTAAELSEAINNGTIKSLEEMAKTPEQIAEDYRKLSQDMIGVTLDNIFNLLINEFWPMFQFIADAVIAMATGIAKLAGGSEEIEKTKITRDLMRAGFDFAKVSGADMGTLRELNSLRATLEDSAEDEIQELNRQTSFLTSDLYDLQEALRGGDRITEEQFGGMTQVLENIQAYNETAAKAAEYGKELPGLPPDLVETMGSLETALLEYKQESVAQGYSGYNMIEVFNALRDAKKGMAQNVNIEVRDSVTPLDKTAQLFRDVVERQQRYAERGGGRG